MHKKLLKHAPMIALASSYIIMAVLSWFTTGRSTYATLAAAVLPFGVMYALDRYLRGAYRWYPLDPDNLDPIEAHCPECGSDDYYSRPSRPVNRCIECDAEIAEWE